MAKHALNRKESAEHFFCRLAARIEHELIVANAPGIRATARQAAAHRASEFLDDLTYLKTRYVRLSGQGNAQ